MLYWLGISVSGENAYLFNFTQDGFIIGGQEVVVAEVRVD
jgi:hypothetical protein